MLQVQGMTAILVHTTSLFSSFQFSAWIHLLWRLNAAVQDRVIYALAILLPFMES